MRMTNTPSPRWRVRLTSTMSLSASPGIMLSPPTEKQTQSAALRFSAASHRESNGTHWMMCS
nr:MAG TPA: hypothetical protein [Caudoviricetes sp.]